MASKTINDNEDDCKVLEFFYTQYGTKLFVKNGVLVEQKLKSLPSSSAVLLDRNRISVPAPSDGGCFKGPLNNPFYSRDPPPPRKPLSLAEIKKFSYQRSIKTAQEGLAYYNRKHPRKYALVRPIQSNGFTRNGFWFHSIFLAKPVEEDGDSTERCFFAELTANGVKFGVPNYLVTLCRPIDGTQTTLGCEICDWMPHPLSGFLKGNPQVQPRVLRSSRVRSSVTREKELASASGSFDAKDISGAKSGKGGEGGRGRKKHTFCLQIQDLHKYIPNFDASENDWMQYM